MALEVETLTFEQMEELSALLLAHFYPQLTSTMEGPLKAALPHQLRQARDAANAVVNYLGSVT